MNIHLIAIGGRMPDWVQKGYEEYAKRLPAECALRLTEISAGKRGKNPDLTRILNDEAQRMLAAIPKSAIVVALEIDGHPWSTQRLANQLQDWMSAGQDLALLIGGPDGLGDAARTRAVQRWSLSPLTLPHPLVRVIVAEQLYRAWSILHRHPYHRA